VRLGFNNSYICPNVICYNELSSHSRHFENLPLFSFYFPVFYTISLRYKNQRINLTNRTQLLGSDQSAHLYEQVSSNEQCVVFLFTDNIKNKFDYRLFRMWMVDTCISVLLWFSCDFSIQCCNLLSQPGPWRHHI
jgi:hypothetical protein